MTVQELVVRLMNFKGTDVVVLNVGEEQDGVTEIEVNKYHGEVFIEERK